MDSTHWSRRLLNRNLQERVVGSSVWFGWRSSKEWRFACSVSSVRKIQEKQDNIQFKLQSFLFIWSWIIWRRSVFGRTRIAFKTLRDETLVASNFWYWLVPHLVWASRQRSNSTQRVCIDEYLDSPIKSAQKDVGQRIYKQERKYAQRKPEIPSQQTRQRLQHLPNECIINRIGDDLQWLRVCRVREMMLCEARGG